MRRLRIIFVDDVDKAFGELEVEMHPMDIVITARDSQSVSTMAHGRMLIEILRRIVNAGDKATPINLAEGKSA